MSKINISLKMICKRISYIITKDTFDNAFLLTLEFLSIMKVVLNSYFIYPKFFQSLYIFWYAGFSSVCNSKCKVLISNRFFSIDALFSFIFLKSFKYSLICLAFKLVQPLVRFWSGWVWLLCFILDLWKLLSSEDTMSYNRIYLPIFISSCQLINLSIRLSHLSVSQSLSLSVSVCLSYSRSLSVCLSVCLSVFLFLSDSLMVSTNLKNFISEKLRKISDV